MLNCSVDLQWIRKDALNPKNYIPIFVRVIKYSKAFDLLEPESSFGEGSPYKEPYNSSFLSISKSKNHIFQSVLVTYNLWRVKNYYFMKKKKIIAT